MVPTTVEWEIVAEMPLERGGDTEEGSFLRIATEEIRSDLLRKLRERGKEVELV